MHTCRTASNDVTVQYYIIFHKCSTPFTTATHLSMTLFRCANYPKRNCASGATATLSRVAGYGSITVRAFDTLSWCGVIGLQLYLIVLSATHPPLPSLQYPTLSSVNSQLTNNIPLYKFHITNSKFRSYLRSSPSSATDQSSSFYIIN